MNNRFSKFVKELSELNPVLLPGDAAHQLLAPQHRKPAGDYLKELSNYKVAAVMAAFVPLDKGDDAGIMLIERTGGADVHASQISFPGGRQEIGEDLDFTAKREMEEEVGVSMDLINVLFPLTPLFIPPSNFLVHPFLGYLHAVPDLKLSEAEVKRVHLFSVNEFLNPENILEGTFGSARGYSVNAPYFKIGDVVIWGATAMMLSEIAELVKPILPALK